ncbi:BLUF domain-containing protein [Aequorivita echinoideorum]|uniref:BLUF domain-containing protein n=1 Tax=Aequorivita echinoideorum TaxID=1549647 RepID=A0ABS5S268_9FLAO|nr:BLUF domain-containing protein [Aequorivita echinoideorum]MBT0607296.1 BLUF domain-containing protein [Aequorivita echinoideorum]
MKHTICYISNETDQLSENELEALFSFILANNPPRDISGILLHNNGIFLQVLEGEKETLKTLFKSIREDKRHHNILTVLSQKINDRIFKGYKAGFSILKDKGDLENLNSYLSLYEGEEKYPKNIQNLLKPFLI